MKKLDYNLYRKIKLNKKYIKETAKDIQDTAAYNIFGTDKRIYMTDAVRNKLKKVAKGLNKASKTHARQAKTIQSVLKKSKKK